jgi:hypothetical protein
VQLHRSKRSRRGQEIGGPSCSHWRIDRLSHLPTPSPQNGSLTSSLSMLGCSICICRMFMVAVAGLLCCELAFRGGLAPLRKVLRGGWGQRTALGRQYSASRTNHRHGVGGRPSVFDVGGDHGQNQREGCGDGKAEPKPCGRGFVMNGRHCLFSPVACRRGFVGLGGASVQSSGR